MHHLSRRTHLLINASVGTGAIHFAIPWTVAEWYKNHGYDFVVITDHNFLTSVDRLNAVYGEKVDFLVIKGVEVCERFGDKRVHICALNPVRLVLPEGSSTILNSLQNNVQTIREAKAVPIIAHPNHRWSFGAEELKQVEVGGNKK